MVVPNGVALPAPVSGPERAGLRGEFGVGDDEVLLVGVGRLTRQKNFAALLEALALLPADGPAWDGVGSHPTVAAVEDRRPSPMRWLCGPLRVSVTLWFKCDACSALTCGSIALSENWWL